MMLRTVERLDLKIKHKLLRGRKETKPKKAKSKNRGTLEFVSGRRHQVGLLETVRGSLDRKTGRFSKRRHGS